MPPGVYPRPMPHSPITPSTTVPDPRLDPTLDPKMQSWVESANDPESDFPIQNLPLCRYCLTEAEDDGPRIGVAIGNRVVDLDMLVHGGFMLDDQHIERLHHVLHSAAANALLRNGDLLRRLREPLQEFLRPGHMGQQLRRLRERAVVPMQAVTWMPVCAHVSYTDFYASIHHATTVGSMFRPDNPLLPNYKHVPIGYHGRASSIVSSGTPVRRPIGQTNTDNAPVPSWGPSRRLDYELEVGCVVGPGNFLGEPIPIAAAHDHIAGLCLVNDWSARDMQAWEYQPLGPFLAKNFATTVSPFLVTVDALAPFRIPGPARSPGDPEPLAYLRGPENWGFDINLEALIESTQMREKGIAPFRLSRGNLRDMFWTFPQMIAHHTSNGCNLLPGDLLASGTVSGASPDSRGCMLELTWQGNGPDGKPLPRKPIELPTGEKRTFLEDGDRVIMKGWCEREGFRRIGFGTCEGTVVSAAESVPSPGETAG